MIMRAGSRRNFIERLEPRLVFAVNPVVIDLLAVYTPAAAAQHGGDSAMTSLIQGSVNTMNLALSNSRIGVTIRLVGAEPITYTGSDNLYADRDHLENPSDGVMDQVHTRRNIYGADLVTLVVEGQHIGGGNGSLMTSLNDPNNSSYAFSAIAENSIGEGFFTLAHEIGHNLGGGHERGNPVENVVGPFSYSYGHRFTAGGVVYHDIMSYDPGQVIPYFANPAVSYHGVPTGSANGNPDSADLASTFAQTAPIVAAYRATVVPDTLSPRAEIYEVSQIGSVVNFTVRYSDDSGIDFSTIDSNDIAVSAGGYTLAAGFVNISNPGLGESFKLAKYRVVLPSSSIPLDSVVFNMRAGAVRDITAHNVPAGAIPRSTSCSTFDAYARARGFGTLSLNETRTVYEQIGTPQSFDDAYQFSLAQPMTVSATLRNMTADASIFFVQDLNGDGQFQSAEIGAGSFRTGAADESFAANLAPGTYFAWVFNAPTSYTLTLRTYTDAIAPMATLDARDITTNGATQFVFNVKFDDNQEINVDLLRYYAPIRLTNPFGGFYIYFADSIDVDFNAATRIATYRVNAGYSLSASDNGIYTVSMEPQNSPIWGVGTPLSNYISDAAGNKLVPTTLGTFRVAIGQADSTVPTAVASPAPVLIGGVSTYEFTVNYRDNVALDAATLDGNDIRVTGPGGFHQLATFISVSSAPTVGGVRTAIYRITAPGGAFDALDDGTYTIAVQSNQVRDSSNNAAVSGTIGLFNVSIPLGGDANRDGTVDIRDLYTLATQFQTVGRGWDEGDFNYDGKVDAFDLGILAGNWQQTLPAPQAPMQIATTSGTLARRTPVRVASAVLN